MYGVGLSSGAETVVGTSQDWNLYVLSRNKKLKWKFATRGGARDAAVSSSGNYIVAGSYLSPTGYVYLFHGNGTLIWEKTFNAKVQGVDIQEYQRRVGVALGNGKVVILDLEGNHITTVNTQKSAWGAWDVAFDSAGRFAIGADDHTAYLAGSNGGVKWKKDLGRKAYIYGVGISYDGNTIAAVTQDLQVVLFNGNGGVLGRFSTGFSNYGAAVSSAGSYTAVGSWDGYLYILDREGKEVWKYNVGDNVNRVAFSPDGGYLAAASGDGNIYLFALTN
jgi:WD40 repeat protein